METNNDMQKLLTAKVREMMRATVKRTFKGTFKSDEEDVVSNAITKMAQAWASFDPAKGDFQGWACVIARNECRNHAALAANNGHGPLTTIGDEDGEEIHIIDDMGAEPARHGAFAAPDTRDDVANRAMADAITEAVLELEADERKFILAIRDGMTQTEAGALVGWSPATATRRRKSIAAKVQEMLDEG